MNSNRYPSASEGRFLETQVPPALHGSAGSLSSDSPVDASHDGRTNETVAPPASFNLTDEVGQIDLAAADLEIEGFGIHGRAGGGAMGEVYHARHATMKRDVALKLIRSLQRRWWAWRTASGTMEGSSSIPFTSSCSPRRRQEARADPTTRPSR